MVYDNPNNPFAGWSGTTAVCAAVGALGGVLVALSITNTNTNTNPSPSPNPNPNPSPNPNPNPNPSPDLNQVALSIKLADSIMKTIATTGAIVLTTALNAVFLNGPYSLPIASGALVVVVSVFNYNDTGD